MSNIFEVPDILIWGIVSIVVYYLFIHKSRRDKLLANFPGPPRPPFIGHMFDFLLTPKKELFPMLARWCDKYGPVVKTFSWSRRFLMLNDPKYIEKILTSNVHLKKGFDYDFVRPWLGDGLLMSDGQKWFRRRKMLTPAFHFKILEDFLPIFNQESLKMVGILRDRHGNGSTLDFAPYATKCTLDIICETAMGKSINAQDGENLEYTQAIREVGEVMQDRAFRPWFRYEFLWRRSELYRRQQKLLNILHGFTDSVIQERKKDRLTSRHRKDTNAKGDDTNESDNIYFGSAKKKKAFLDLLLDVQEDVGDSQLTDQDLREETDTFMFEGHDTTSVGISFTIYALGAYPDIQAQVREEMDSIFGDDKERPVTTEDLTKMKYLELVIKESLRVYPSVPFIQRYLTQDLMIDDNIVIPGEVTVGLFIYHIHKNPKYFPNPHVFNPERFRETDPRNPFAYIPFSAGPRNCIGQKFAMMEEKIILANMIRNFEIKSLTKPKDLVVQSELTIRSNEGIKIQLTPR